MVLKNAPVEGTPDGKRLAKALARYDPTTLARLRRLSRDNERKGVGPQLTEEEIQDACRYARTLHPPPVPDIPAVRLPDMKPEGTARTEAPAIRPAEMPKAQAPPTRASQATLDVRLEPRQDGLVVRISPRDADLAARFARKANDSDRPADALARDPAVELCLALSGDSCLVRVQESGKVLHLKKNGGKFESAWVEQAVLGREVERAEHLRLDLSASADQRVLIDANARGPPEGAKPIDVRHGESNFEASLSADGKTIFVRVKNLPRELRDAPEKLLRLFRDADAAELGKELARGGRPRIGRADPVSADKPLVIRLLEAGNKSEAAELLAKDPLERRKELDADLAEHTHQIDRALNQGHPIEALARVAKAVRVHGEKPGLLLRRGVAELLSKRAEAAADSFSRLAEKTGDAQPVLAEINRQLRYPRLVHHRGALLMAARIVVARTMKKIHKTASEVKLVVSDGQVQFEAHLAAEPKVEKARSEDVKPDSTLYLADAPDLVNRDWSATGRQRSLGQALEGDEYELLAVHKPDPVLQTKPDVLIRGKGDKQQRYRAPPRHDSPDRGKPGVAAGTYRRVMYSLLATANPPPRRDDDDEEEVEYMEVDEPIGQANEQPVPKKRVIFIIRKKAKRVK